MKYMGSKAKVARYIVPIIQEQIERSGYETYLEPFCGCLLYTSPSPRDTR